MGTGTDISDQKEAVCAMAESQRAAEKAREASEEARQEAEDAREAAEQLKVTAEEASKNQSIFVTNMSHEIRTPLVSCIMTVLMYIWILFNLIIITRMPY